MPIPLVDLQANYKSIKDEVDAALLGVVDSGHFVLGPEVTAFENDFAAYVGTRHCVGVGSGTSALELAMRVLGIGPGDEVITQANTFVATCLGISSVGAKPVLIDCTPDTYQINVDDIAAKISERTKAILPVHLYGQCADMDPILELAASRDLKVVEDAAQAHGATYKGRRAGSMGDAGCFSFYPGKNLGAYGDGGAITTNSDSIANQLLYWRNLGSKVKHHHEVKGMNSRLDSVQAAVLRVKLRRLDQWNKRRAKWAAMYGGQLAGVGDLQLPVTAAHGQPAWHLYVLQTGHRDELLQHLLAGQIGAGIHYPMSIHELGAYAELEVTVQALPVATAAARRILSLPLYPELEVAGVDEVVARVKSFFA